MERRDIPTLFNDEYWGALKLWNRYKLFGLPFDGGWAEQPAAVIDVLEALESASRAVERERMDKWQSQKNSASR